MRVILLASYAELRAAHLTLRCIHGIASICARPQDVSPGHLDQGFCDVGVQNTDMLAHLNASGTGKYCAEGPACLHLAHGLQARKGQGGASQAGQARRLALRRERGTWHAAGLWRKACLVGGGPNCVCLRVFGRIRGSEAWCVAISWRQGILWQILWRLFLEP